jgi:hypothetical protein
VLPPLTFAAAKIEAAKMQLYKEGTGVQLSCAAGMNGATAGQALLECNPALLTAATPLTLFAISAQTTALEASSHMRSLVEDGYLRVLLPAEFALSVCLLHAMGAADPFAPEDQPDAVLNAVVWPWRYDFTEAEIQQPGMFANLAVVAKVLRSGARELLSTIISRRIKQTGIASGIHVDGAAAALMELMIALSWMPLLEQWPQVSHCGCQLLCI